MSTQASKEYGTMGQTYKVSGTLAHAGAEYADGQDFTSDDEALLAQLHREKVLLLPEEFAAAAAAEGNQGAVQQLAAEREAKDQRIADLEAQLAALQAGKKSGKADGE